jgi:chromosome partitioning protein
VRAKTLVFTNLKGGVGKTTCVYNLCAGLRRRGFKVLCVDMDPQGNVSVAWLGAEILLQRSRTMRDVLDRDLNVNISSVIRHTEYGVDVAPSNLSLAGREFDLAMDASNGAYVLKERIEKVKGQYDYIVIDTGPSLGHLTVNSLFASDCAIIPVPPEFFSLVGADEVRKVLVNIQKRREKEGEELKINILITRVRQRLILTREVMEQLRRIFGGSVLQTTIRESIRLAESPSHKTPIFEYDPNGTGAEDFERLTEEVIRNVAPHN